MANLIVETGYVYEINTLPTRHHADYCTARVLDVADKLQRGDRLYPRGNEQYIRHKLGKGAQGSAYALSIQDRITAVVKVTDSPDIVLFELQVLGLSSDRTNMQHTDITSAGVFLCLPLDILQAVHFTLNNFAYTRRGDQLRNIANAHGDIHPQNIIQTDYRARNGIVYKLPTLIDYGLDANYYFYKLYDVEIEIYNHIYRRENMIARKNEVLKNRLYSLWQNVDFCETLILINLRSRMAARKLIDHYPRYFKFFRRVPYHLTQLKPLFVAMLHGLRSAENSRGNIIELIMTMMMMMMVTKIFIRSESILGECEY
ncbi:hypothetical protein SNEBB_009154 [Seison nebaliae]|nr:hypothetical protein SNEBB_009154 [Seison nebaliae]